MPKLQMGTLKEVDEFAEIERSNGLKIIFFWSCPMMTEEDLSRERSSDYSGNVS